MVYKFIKCFTNLIIFILKNSIVDNTIGLTNMIRVLNYSNKKKLKNIYYSIVKDSNDE